MLSSGFLPNNQTEPQDIQDWQIDWAVREDFSINIDSQGFSLPVSIVFVPNPGLNPKDPLYFVIELRGKIKVVTNDRSVFTFADNQFFSDSDRVFVSSKVTDEFGQTGICLAPNEGYVFVTFSYKRDGELINNIVRYKTKPQTFSVAYDDSLEIGQIFSGFPTNVSHQIGHCQIRGEELFVSVGDGFDLYEPPLGLDTPLGKVLRLNFDGSPNQDNPFYKDADIHNPANYVWALGFRNPYGLALVDGEVFVAENGQGMDRFARLKKGEDYLWDGTDRSIGLMADYSIFPGIGPTQMAYYSADSQVFSEDYRDSFFIGMSVATRGGIFQLPYDLDSGRINAVPKEFLIYNRPANDGFTGIIVGVAMGPDGLYFAPLLSNDAELGTVFKVQYDPANAHPFILSNESGPQAIIAQKGCASCHEINGAAGGISGPSLETESLILRLDERLNLEAYMEQLNNVDSLDEKPFINYAEARQEVRQAQGIERVYLWVFYHILQPKFDNPAALMPSLGLNKEEARILTDYLIGEVPLVEVEDKGEPIAIDEENSINMYLSDVKGWVSEILPTLRYRHLVFAFLTGFILSWAAPRIYRRIRSD